MKLCFVDFDTDFGQFWVWGEMQNLLKNERQKSNVFLFNLCSETEWSPRSEFLKRSIADSFQGQLLGKQFSTEFNFPILFFEHADRPLSGWWQLPEMLALIFDRASETWDPPDNNLHLKSVSNPTWWTEIRKSFNRWAELYCNDNHP